MDFENVLKEVGHFGRYQKVRLVLLSAPILITVLHLYIQVFAAGKSDHWCRSWKNEDCRDLNLTQKECEDIKKDISIPLKQGTSNQTENEFEQCVKYNVTRLDFKEAIAGKVTLIDKIPCDDGWVHDRSVFPSTIIIDFELVCGRSYLPNIVQSVYFVGYLVGSSAFGVAADMFGRRNALLFCYTTGGLFGLITVFSSNVWMYLILRFCIATVLKGTGLCCFVLVTELVAPSKRVFVGNFMWLFFAAGYTVLAGSAKLIPNWRILQLVLTLPFIPLLIITYFFVPESPRWLINQKRSEDAEKVLRKMAKVNERIISDDFMERAFNTNEFNHSSKLKGTLKEVIRSRVFLILLINMCFNWAVQSLVFYGLSLSTSSLGIDPYISFIVSGAIEVPAYLSCMFAAEWFGRKGATFGTMMLGGICCCVTPLIRIVLGRVFIAMAGKFFITMSFSIVYTWGTELLPTALRSSGMGLFSTSSRFGGIVAPLILILEEVWPSLPVLVFGSFSIAAGCLCLLLPETKGKPLPSTTRETISLYRKIDSGEGKGEKGGTNEDEKKYAPL